MVSIIAFMFVHLTPGDPIRIMFGSEMDKETYEEIKEREGFNDPLIVQYGRYMGSLLQGDLGTSYRTRSKVSEEIGKRFGYTFNLAMLSMVWAVALGLSIGILSAVKRNSFWDRISMVTSISLVSMPSFWMGLVLMQIFAVGLGWLPTSGTGTFKHMLLPSIVLGTGVAAVIARFTRSSLLETMKEDYIRTARSKGQSRLKVIWKHGLKNAMIPVVTMTGLQFGFLIGGAVVVEQVFSWPGLGSYLVDAILIRDYPVVQALIMLFSLQFLLVNLFVDLTYAYLNPQIRYE